MDNETIVTITYSDGSKAMRTVKKLRLQFAHESKEFQVIFFSTLESKGEIDILTAKYKLQKPQYNFEEKLKLKTL
jgi:hypothetical protein